jgi:hypothetical protein
MAQPSRRKRNPRLGRVVNWIVYGNLHDTGNADWQKVRAPHAIIPFVIPAKAGIYGWNRSRPSSG